MKCRWWSPVCRPWSSLLRALNRADWRLPAKCTPSRKDSRFRTTYRGRWGLDPKTKIQNTRFILSVASWLMFPGCAAQGPPRPPRLEIPQRAADLAVHQVGRSLELSFTPPALATDGEGLTKPVEAEIFREIAPPGEALSKVPRSASQGTMTVSLPYSAWVSLTSADLSRLAHGPKVVYVDEVSQQHFPSSLGSTFSYRVRALTRGFRGRPILGEASNAAAATLLDVSDPVQNLRVVPTEKAISLDWEPPARTLSGALVANLTGYRVYRSEEPNPNSFHVVGEPGEPAFLDPSFQFGRTYVYRVRAAFKQGAQEAESADSQPSAVTPKDIFPPASPQGLTALYTIGAVELIWDANREPDLAGYNVYRREEGKRYERINKDPVRTPIYRDSAFEPSHSYLYQVTAVDLSGNESKPSTEVRVDTE